MNDLINRQAAIDAVKHAWAKGLEPSQYIEDLPSAQPKHGRWIDRDVLDTDEAAEVVDEWQVAKCSVCGVHFTAPYLYYFDDYNYCPNCGAYMRGEEDG